MTTCRWTTAMLLYHVIHRAGAGRQERDTGPGVAPERAMDRRTTPQALAMTDRRLAGGAGGSKPPTSTPRQVVLARSWWRTSTQVMVAWMPRMADLRSLAVAVATAAESFRMVLSRARVGRSHLIALRRHHPPLMLMMEIQLPRWRHPPSRCGNGVVFTTAAAPPRSKHPACTRQLLARMLSLKKRMKKMVRDLVLMAVLVTTPRSLAERKRARKQ